MTIRVGSCRSSVTFFNSLWASLRPIYMYMLQAKINFRLKFFKIGWFTISLCLLALTIHVPAVLALEGLTEHGSCQKFEAVWPSDLRVGLTMQQSQARDPLQRLAGFVLCHPEFRSFATLVNSQLVASCQLGFLILLCCIWIICFFVIEWSACKLAG